LATFHENLLSVWLDTSQGVELELEHFTGGGRIELDIVLLSLMFHNYYSLCKQKSRGFRGSKVTNPELIPWWRGERGGGE